MTPRLDPHGLRDGKLEKAFGRNRIPIYGDNRKSIVLPAESMARYKEVHCPATRMYVSSTRHERFGFRISDRIRSFRTGAYRSTQRAMVE